ncbi:MAG: DUF1015 domain-containing protein, partial [Deltaproteobacteria bacterium]|nr:DUF1015 domain-containing protein [Deltaproteobacteria bacterium]
MAVLMPFRALRPRKAVVEAVAALPYDVMDVEEAREMVRRNPLSFLRVEKSEVDVPAYPGGAGDQVYEMARLNLEALIRDGILVQDDKSCLYLYRLRMGDREQTGVVAGLRIEDYEAGRIRKHELTRADKEAERTRHIDTVNAHTGAIFMTYRGNETISRIVDGIKRESPEYDFVSTDGIGHTVWVVCRDEEIRNLVEAFATIPALYIADGHTRSAAAAAVARRRRERNPFHRGDESYNTFPAVLFPDDEVRIMDYNRAVRDLGGLTESAFLEKVAKIFQVREGFPQKSPSHLHEFGMYLPGHWYRLILPAERVDTRDPVKVLDVSLLQELLLGPVFGIADPRTDNRIKFIGGIRGMVELERLVDSGAYAVAFSLFPTALEQLMGAADAGQVMPPKSTWFEPKLRSG